MLRFTKMHGIGNDYVYVNGFEESVPDPTNTAKRIADRHFGVGGGGLIIVLPPDHGVDAHVRMRMFNADGSESEMCGNGIRCVCKLAHDRGISHANPMKIQTGRGVLSLSYTVDGAGKVDRVTVDMGEPILELGKVPVRRQRLAWFDSARHAGAIESADMARTGTFVSMGNPHVVLFDDANPLIASAGIQQLELDRLGPGLETHAAFPSRINVHFVQVVSRDEVIMRTWERGSGITLACGTGAAAVCVAGVLTRRTDRTIRAHLPGGDLNLSWDSVSNSVLMTGPATEVFTGSWLEQ